jgi:hypothetical protein
VKDLGDPLLLDVVERVGRVDREADEDDVRVRVREGTETVVVFLTGGIPEGELDALAIDDDVRNAGKRRERGKSARVARTGERQKDALVLEDGRNVDL